MVYHIPQQSADKDWVELPFSSGSQGPTAILTLKSCGDMRLSHDSDRSRFFSRMGIEATQVAGVKQVHSRRVLVARRDVRYPKADGLITADPDIVLTITVADCIPIYIFDVRTRVRALLHSGWKGTGIVSAAVAQMNTEFNCHAEDLRSLLGPCIASSCYKVDENRFNAYREEFGDPAVAIRVGGYYIDMRGANLQLLRRIGIDDVSVVEDCTHCHPLLASYRRDGADNYGLMLAVFGNFQA